jgi:SAM-dependent methyltransferase
MSRLSDIVHLLRYGMRSPRETASLLNLAVKMMREAQVSPRETASLLNFLVSGMQSSRGMVFAPQRQDRDGPPEAPNPILSYFNAHTEGPGVWKWMHYFDIYHRHFSKFIGREVHVLEVGIYSGGSLTMWREYFGKGCRVYGVDIQEASRAYKDVGIEVFIGDQADRSFWTRVKHAVPTLDILIDDGGHLHEQQRVTLEEMLPHIAPGGVYLCEDIHGVINRFAAYVQGLASGLNSVSTCEMTDEVSRWVWTASNFQAAISSIHLYPFVAVIEKREQSLDRLISLKHGTQWRVLFDDP